MKLDVSRMPRAIVDGPSCGSTVTRDAAAVVVASFDVPG